MFLSTRHRHFFEMKPPSVPTTTSLNRQRVFHLDEPQSSAVIPPYHRRAIVISEISVFEGMYLNVFIERNES